jgi:peptidoglycan-associated lipoprotein
VRLSGTSLLVAVLAATSLTACARRAPADLPPAPPPSSESGATDPGESEWERMRREFIAQAGSDTVHFETDSHALDAQSREILEGQARWLLANPHVNVTIEGHCDERGTREYNLALGERRANAAKNFLAARGVPESRMRTISWGKERPVALGSDESAWAQNRRAVTVLPTGR